MKNLLLCLILISSTCLASAQLEQIYQQRIKQYFISIAKKTLQELQEISNDHDYDGNTVDINELVTILNHAQILVSGEELLDNSGSLVDSLGYPNKVILSQESWATFIKSNLDIRLHIIHEILRMANINDDNYIISKELYGLLLPIIDQQEMTIKPYCNLRARKTVTVIKTKKMNGKGTSIVPQSNIIIYGNGNSSFKEAQNAAYRDALNKCKKAGYSNFNIISGMQTLKTINRNFQKMSGVEVKLQGQCIKTIIKMRNQNKVRSEVCKKIHDCQLIYEASPAGTITPKDYYMLDILHGDNGC